MDTLASDDIESRARLIAARAQRLLDDEEADWSGYCLPGCSLCAIELAREQLDEERYWTAAEEARAAGDEAMRQARGMVEGTGLYERVSS